MKDLSSGVRTFKDPEELFDSAARFILSLISPETSRFTIALAGGTTPRELYQRMVRDDLRGHFPWEKMHFFWGDERFVPGEDPRSNYRMAKESLLDPAGIPKTQIHPVNTALASVEAAVSDYEKKLTDFFKVKPGTFPIFDLVLLGLGEDGHTASLFPGDPVLLEERRMAAPSKLNTSEPRVTLTFPVINHARQVMFLVSGEKKKEILRNIFSGKETEAVYPAQKVQPLSGGLSWFLAV